MIGFLFAKGGTIGSPLFLSLTHLHTPVADRDNVRYALFVAPFLAGAVAYQLFFALIPLLALVVGILGFVYGSERAQQELVQLIRDIYPSATAQETRIARQLVDGRALSLGIGIVGTILATGVIHGSFDKALAAILGAGGKRGLVRGQVEAFAFVGGIGALAVLSFAVSYGVLAAEGALASVLGPWPRVVVGVLSPVFGLAGATADGAPRRAGIGRAVGDREDRVRVLHAQPRYLQRVRTDRLRGRPAHLDLRDRGDHPPRCGSDKAEKNLSVERLEAIVSRAIEGWSARLFGAKLQPVQIAKRLIRTMEAHQTISLSKTFVPNSYVVSLSATDFAQFEQYRRSLERDLAEAVLSAARERNFTLLDFPSVEIERDDDVAPGDIRVSCALVDASGDEVEADPKSLGAVESGHTMVLDREKLLRERPRAPKASVEVTSGERSSVQLGPEPLLIGRDQQNDVVLDDPRVSRKHAEIRLRLGRYTLYDLQSTNGTYVNGRRVAEVVLNDGDRISVAGLDLIFRSAD